MRPPTPFAACSSEPDLFGPHILRPTRALHTPASFQIGSVIPIGNYALQPNWMDGHTYGIWTYESLRRFCDCGASR